MAVYLFFYRLFLLLYTTGIRIATVQNKKAKLWLQGRKNWPKRLEQQVEENFAPGQPVVWMHCASLGEFEQGRPVIEKLKADYPDTNFIISFFSPSGYEVRKKYEGAQVVCYLPMDGPANADRFLEIVKPDLVLWVKYEYWYYYLTQIGRRNIPLLLVSGIFREDQPFFKWYNKLHCKMLNYFTHLFLQDADSKHLLHDVGITNVTISGDTRFDRVITIAENFLPIERVEQWLDGANQVMVCGSTWDEDEEEISHYIRLHPEIRFIIAPHNVNEEEITELQELLPGTTLFSRLPENVEGSHVLIVDTIGLLSRLYHYATITYVGGGFGAGIHNVLEAAVWGKPVVHGPEYEKFAEAKDLIAAGGSFTAEDALELEKLLNRLFTDAALYEKAAAVCKTYVQRHQGATGSILHYIQANRLLTKS